MERQLKVGYNEMQASLVVQTVKNLPATQETWVRSLGGEDRLEKGMATHYSIFAWSSPRTEEPGVQQSVSAKSFQSLQVDSLRPCGL